MEPDNNTVVINIPSEGKNLSDDTYLTEMTDRIQRLRALIAEKAPDQVPKKRRAKSRRKAN